MPLFNLIILNDTCEMDGGSARIALEDAAIMARRGHRVIFFSACGKPPEPDNADGIEWISLGQNNILTERRRWLAISRGLWNFEAAAALKKMLKTLPSENTVVHLHSWSKALSGSVVHAVRRQRVRLVCTLHDYFVACPNGGLYDYPTRTACLLRPMSAACILRNCDSRSYAHKIWRVLRQVIWRYAADIPRCFDHRIAVSDFAARKTAESLPGHFPIDVIGNLPNLLQRDLQPLPMRHEVIYAGRVSPEKGPDLYLEACARANVPAVICGDGPMIAQLKAQWPAARFTGWLRPEVLQDRLRQALVLVVPSRCYETYGMVAAEAAAAGVAVIVPNDGAAAESVIDGVTGLHFRGGDAADLAEKIAYLKSKPQLAYAMGEAGYARFWANYAEQRQRRAEKIEACYNLGATAA